MSKVKFNKRVFLLLSIPYVPIRAMPYIFGGIEYLWWHFLLDVACISLYILIAFLVRE